MAHSRFIPPSVDNQGAATPTPPYLQRPRSSGSPNFQRTTIGAPLSGEGGGPQQPVDPLVAELNALHEQAKQEGVSAGIEEARKMAEDEFRGRLRASQASLERLAVVERTLTEAYRTQVLELTIGMAESVLQRELADHGAARELVERAVAAFEDVGRIDAVVSAAEAEMMEAWAQERRAAGLDIQVHVDANLEAGDVQIRSDAGSLESHLRDRFDQACEMIRGTKPTSKPTSTPTPTPTPTDDHE